jgi:hypothetical protein
LDGRLIAIKDNICTKKEPTTCASKILDGFWSPNAATVVAKLEAAGALIAGKTNLDEFGMGCVSIDYFLYAEDLYSSVLIPLTHIINQSSTITNLMASTFPPGVALVEVQ